MKNDCGSSPFSRPPGQRSGHDRPHADRPVTENGIQRLTLIGVLGALSVALSALEGWLPALPVLLALPVPGVRLGLANLAVTAALFWLGLPAALSVGILKTAFVLLTRGLTAAMMTGAGTLLAVLAMAVMRPLYSRRAVTFVGVGVAGAAAHTIGQLSVAALLLGAGAWYYTPPLLLCAAACGTLTGLLLNLLLPRLETVRIF